MSKTKRAFMGQGCIFRGKEGGARYQGIVTKKGAALIERHRRRLSQLTGRPLKWVSDGDTFEYLARGEAETLKYLAQQ